LDTTPRRKQGTRKGEGSAKRKSEKEKKSSALNAPNKGRKGNVGAEAVTVLLNPNQKFIKSTGDQGGPILEFFGGERRGGRAGWKASQNL